MEKTLIARSDPNVSLNRSNEIMTKCRHRLPYFLNNFHGLQLPPVLEVEDVQQHDLIQLDPQSTQSEPQHDTSLDQSSPVPIYNPHTQEPHHLEQDQEGEEQPNGGEVELERDA